MGEREEDTLRGNVAVGRQDDVDGIELVLELEVRLIDTKGRSCHSTVEVVLREAVGRIR